VHLQITDVSTPRGDSFEEARMTFEEVEAALDKGMFLTKLEFSPYHY
jgi:hypothetical protein